MIFGIIKLITPVDPNDHYLVLVAVQFPPPLNKILYDDAGQRWVVSGPLIVSFFSPFGHNNNQMDVCVVWVVVGIVMMGMGWVLRLMKNLSLMGIVWCLGWVVGIGFGVELLLLLLLLLLGVELLCWVAGCCC